jgi:hypothetical protein
MSRRVVEGLQGKFSADHASDSERGGCPATSTPAGSIGRQVVCGKGERGGNNLEEREIESFLDAAAA